MPSTEAVRELLAAFLAARESVTSDGSALEGHIRITAPSLFGRLFPPAPTAAFLARHLGVRVSLLLSDRVADYAAEGIDLAIRIADLGDSSFRGRKLSENRRVLCAAPAYLDLHGRPKTPADLRRHECLVFAGEDRWSFQTKSGRQTIRVSGRLDSDSADLIKSSTLLGLGISLRSLWDVQEDLAAGRLEQVLPKVRIVSKMAIWSIFPPGRYTSRATRAFADMLQASLALP